MKRAAQASIFAFAAAVAGAQTLTFTQAGAIPGPVDLVKVQGNYAYTSADKTLNVFDISNPSAPKRTGSYTFPEKIWGFNVVGSLVYVADDFFGLGIVDVSDPSHPSLRGSLKTPGQAKSVVVSGGKALVADHMSGVDYIDVSNASKPGSLGSFFLDGYARDVALTGTIATAVDSPTGLYVFDLTKTGPLEAVGTVQAEQASPARSVSISESGGVKLACVASGLTLQIYDLSNVAMPVLTSTYRATGGRVPRVALKGKLAYIADGKEGLAVLDLSSPSKPALAGTFKTPGIARDVAAGDSVVLVVVAGGDAGQQVLILKQGS